MKNNFNNIINISIIAILIVSKFLFKQEIYKYFLCISCFILFLSSLYHFIKFKKDENKINIPLIMEMIITLILFVFFIVV